METLGVGLIGYGLAGQTFHAPVISSVPGLKLHAVVERSGERSLEKYPEIKLLRTAEELVQDPDISLVVIATPNAAHAKLAKLAMEHGKHVVIDKPFTVYSSEADELIAVSERQGVVLSAFHYRRWDGDFLTVKQIVETGTLGKVVEFESHFDRYTPFAAGDENWRNEQQPGSGVLYDLGPHLIDQALELFGKPRRLFADVRAQRPGAVVDDYFEVVLEFDEVKAILKAGSLVRELGPRFTLHGTKGSFVKYGLDPQEDALKSGQTPAMPDWGREPEQQWGKLNTEFSGLHVIGAVETLHGSYQSYYEDIYNAIVSGREPAVSAKQAREIVVLIEKAVESSARREMIEL
ncbi:oxidoreductase [Paenibacillaceae bacterium]|nr:oxidoreductase [Paenibacillaceae bacterium]